MEQTKKLAETHFAKYPEEMTKMIERFYSLDKLKVGKIGVPIFDELWLADQEKILGLSSGETYVKKIDFTQFDEDKDGFLDFDGFRTLNFLGVKKRPVCIHCNWFLLDKFYSCLICHQKKEVKESYNLCSGCYYAKVFKHEHDKFIDNDSLFWEMKEELQEKADYSSQITAETSSSQSNGDPSKPKKGKKDTIKNALKGFSNALRCFGDVADAMEFLGDLQD